MMSTCRYIEKQSQKWTLFNDRKIKIKIWLAQILVIFSSDGTSLNLFPKHSEQM